MGEEAAVKRYEPGPAFEEVKEEAMLDISPTESKEFWLIQWIKDKDLDASGFHGKELSLKLHKDGNLGSLESSSGKSYDLVSFAYQQPDATVFLPSGSETKAVGKISRRVCLVRHREHEELKKPNFGSLAPSSKKSAETRLHPKNELLEYASKRGIQAPLYCAMQGPPFKSKVVIDGLTFESPEEYPTRKAAEGAAAKLALASLPDQSPAPSIPYKGILLKLAKKEDYALPHYRTMVNVLNTPAAFISTVAFGGLIFKGEPGKSKIQAQKNAAKVACQHFKKSSSNKTLAKKKKVGAMSTEQTKYCSSQDSGLSVGAMSREQTPEHDRKSEDESNVGDPDVSGKTSEGPDAPGAQSNTATEMPQNTREEPPKKKVKIAEQ